MMNDTQERVWEYLLHGGDERIQALKDLSERGYFNCPTADTHNFLLATYLDENPRGFCHDGIERFKAYIDPVMHLMDYNRKKAKMSEMNYHGLCGYESNTASRLVHSAMMPMGGTTKLKLCEKCLRMLRDRAEF